MKAGKEKENIELVSWSRPGPPESAAELIRRGLDLAKAIEKRHGDLLRDYGHLEKQTSPDPFSKSRNSLGMEFVFISPGIFTMGSSPDEPGRKAYETQHQVTLSRGFHLQTTPVTVAQWRTFAQETGFRTRAETSGGAFVWSAGKWLRKKGCCWNNPGFDQSDSHPVTCISWDDAQAFVDWLDRIEKKRYRLPTEAEWEYSCRAGSTARFFFGEDEGILGDYAWYWENSSEKAHRVAQKKPNPWGLYDMHGNVWELCEDRCGMEKKEGRLFLVTNTYRNGIIDPLCWDGFFRVSRGGDYLCPARSCRSAKRLICSPKSGNNARGFRVARNP